MSMVRIFKRLLKGIAETLVLILANPCYKCVHENDCEFIGYCGDDGPSFYKRREEKTTIKEEVE